MFLFVLTLSAQIKPVNKKVLSKETSFKTDSSSTKRAKGFKEKATINMYLEFNLKQDSIEVDTTLSIKKEYKYNYLQKDNFGLMPFANIGQTYNSLTNNFKVLNVSPSFGATSKHFNYLEAEDINYYKVPTPWTRLTYKTAFEQGQLLDAFFTVNLTKNFNFSIAYKGLRSLGNYQNALTSSGNFRFTTSYTSNNDRYNLNLHYVAQDILNQENGGLKDSDLQNFQSGNEEYIDRSVFDPNFQNAENNLIGKRFFIKHAYTINKTRDTINNKSLKLEQELNYEDKYYQFNQTTPLITFFGNTFTSEIDDKVTLQNFRTNIGLSYSDKVLGNLKVLSAYTAINYGYNSIVLNTPFNIPNRIKTNFFGLNASYNKAFKNFSIDALAKFNLSESYKGTVLDGKITYELNNDIEIKAGVNIASTTPNLNYLLYQSDYLNYNWYNFETFKTQNTQQISFGLQSNKFFNANIDVTSIDNFTYFNLTETTSEGLRIIKPTQYNNPLQYLRLKLQREFKLGHFALDNTIMYQNINSEDDVLNVPTILTRNTLYYTNQLFKKAMTLQTGVVFNYFSKYNMNGYDPLISEFYTQNQTKIGGFPRFDLFVNAKIRQTRIFIKAEHLNAAFTGYNYFSAPNHPYRDFTIRFGLVWDFFL